MSKVKLQYTILLEQRKWSRLGTAEVLIAFFWSTLVILNSVVSDLDGGTTPGRSYVAANNVKSSKGKDYTAP